MSSKSDCAIAERIGRERRLAVWASVIGEHYEEGSDAAAYAAASVIFLSRWYEGRHWVSDSAAGALIGYSVGKSVVRFNRRRAPRKRRSLSRRYPYGLERVSLSRCKSSETA